MPVPEFILELRKHVGHAPLWLTGVTAVVLRDHDGERQVLLVHRADTHEWSPVAGIVEPGEEVAEAVVREVAEEASVQAVVERLAWVSTTPPVHYANGDQAQYVDHTFLMTWVAGDPAPGDDEATDARWFAVDDLPPMRERFRRRIEVALADESQCRLGHGN